MEEQCECGGTFELIHIESRPGTWYYLTGEEDDLWEEYQCKLCLNIVIIELT